MSFFKWITVFLLVSLCSISLAGSLSLAGMSSESTWFNAYEQYGYNPGFEDEFLKAVGGKSKGRIYHLGAGTVICSSLENTKEFYEHTKSSGSSRVINYSSNAYPACFKPHFRNVVAFKLSSDGVYTKYKIIMTRQASWRSRFYDNKTGSYAVFEGWTVSELEVNKLPWNKFIESDTKRFYNDTVHIRNRNNIPDENNRYPLD